MEKSINSSKNVSNFEFIKDTKRKIVLYDFSYYVFFMYEEIQNGDLPKKLEELKAHNIFVYLGSIIEAIIYYFVNISLTDEKSKRKYLNSKEFISLHKIEKTDNLYICELVFKEKNLNEFTHFNDLIHGLSDKKLLDKILIDKIDYFRSMRNLVHINNLMMNEYNLADELAKAFTYTKEIIDEIKKKLK